MRLGRLGEEIAARFLEARGARVIAWNVRLGHGEIDLHVDIRGSSVAVEVKTIRAAVPGDDALRQFTAEKADTVRQYARRLTPPAYRVDVVAVTIHADRADIRWVPFAA